MMRRPRAAIAMYVLLLGLPGVAAGSTDPLRMRAHPPALPAVVRAVEAGRHGALIPAHLIPALPTIRMFPRRYRIPSACIARDWVGKTTSRVCKVGRRSTKKLLVLFGDSHAFMWLPAVLVMAERDGWGVVPLIRFGCTPGEWFTHAGPDVCRDWFRWAVSQIRRLHPTVTMLTGSIGERPSAETQAAVDGIVTAAKRLEGIGPLVVIGDPEGPAADPVPCVTAPHASMAGCTTTWPPSALAAYDAVSRRIARLEVGFLPTRGFVCYERRCPAVVGHTIVWMDNSHLTGIYSAEVAGPFRAAFLRA